VKAMKVGGGGGGGGGGWGEGGGGGGEIRGKTECRGSLSKEKLEISSLRLKRETVGKKMKDGTLLTAFRCLMGKFSESGGGGGRKKGHKKE